MKYRVTTTYPTGDAYESIHDTLKDARWAAENAWDRANQRTLERLLIESFEEDEDGEVIEDSVDLVLDVAREKRWDYGCFMEEFCHLVRRYMPEHGQGETLASQIVTAVVNLNWGWHKNGDAFDTTHHLAPSLNDVSCYANWLDQHTDAGPILEDIEFVRTEREYLDLLRELSRHLLKPDRLEALDKLPADGTIYHCSGRFSADV